MNTLIDLEPIENNPSGKSNEWYTPAKYIEAAREVMGEIDLDPASCALANETVKAKSYYTEQDDGLTQEWGGYVWLNPPFSNHGQQRWSGRLLDEYRHYGNVKQAILLVTANTEVTWFQPLFDYPICFVRLRLNYQSPDPDNFLHTHQSRFGTCFIYFGPNEAKFAEVFGKFGRVVKAIDTSAPKPIALDLWTPTTVAS